MFNTRRRTRRLANVRTHLASMDAGKRSAIDTTTPVEQFDGARAHLVSAGSWLVANYLRASRLQDSQPTRFHYLLTLLRVGTSARGGRK